MIQMIDLRVFRDHLAAAGTDLVEIGTARNLAAVAAQAIVYPSAYLVPLGESATGQVYMATADLRQEVTFLFGVILAVRDIDSRTGTIAMNEAGVVREQVMRALATYRAPGTRDVCIPIRGRLLSGLGNQGAMFWQDDYSVGFRREIIAGGP